MPIAIAITRNTCLYCLWTARSARSGLAIFGRRQFTSYSYNLKDGSPVPENDIDKKEEQGAMSRRLAQMSEESLETGGTGARKAVAEAGFDEELKRRLEERIAGASFKSEHASAYAQMQLPSSAGRGTRDIAGAKAWDGNETVEDAALRMLNDAHRPLRGSARSSLIRTFPARVDTGRPRNKQSSGTRLATAKERTSIYNTMKDVGMTDQEREQYKKEMKDRFSPGARPMPVTMSGLASLANERIEDAIARGQFKNLPRGKKLERDHMASSPFLDTTEYLMNKIIQRQEIVPPWIEKQQELVSTATRFRARLRNDWKRHAARMIASQGGTLEDQVRRAQSYALAEAIENPSKRKVESFSAVDAEGYMSQITLAGELKATSDSGVTSGTTESHIEIREIPFSADCSAQDSPEVGELGTEEQDSVPSQSQTLFTGQVLFRDPAWESTEHPYHKLTIANLNSLTRSYNLIAPQLAQKPYFSLERELKACYADVAPLLPAEIRERATRPRVKVEVIGHTPGSILEKAFERQNTRVHDENLNVKGYGFKQFWKDLWKRDGV